MSWQKEVITAFSVWLIYLADRWVDAFVRATTDHETASHVFSRKHGKIIGSVLLALVVFLSIFAPLCLTSTEFLRGAAMLVIASLYFWMTHRSSQNTWMSFVPKEAAVGALFALGTVALVNFSDEFATLTLLAAVGSFAALCFLNCAFITRWERTGGDLRSRSSLLNAFPWLVNRLPTCGVALVIVSLAWSLLSYKETWLPLAASAALLGWLDSRSGSLSPNALRVLADVVLLTPLLFALHQV